MDDVKALVAQNSINLPPEKITSIQNAIARGQVSYLSPDKEAGPFMLFLVGESLESIAKKTAYPVDVIYLTAMRYQWLAKADNLEKDKLGALAGVQHDIINLLAVATHVTLQKQLADIIAGRADPSSCALLPKNIHGLEKLMNMINSLKPDGDKEQPSVNLTLNLQGGKPGDNAEVIDIPKSRITSGTK